jgi:hypothetical protein
MNWVKFAHDSIELNDRSSLVRPRAATKLKSKAKVAAATKVEGPAIVLGLLDYCSMGL